MRTTIRLDDELFAQAKQLAAQTGRTLAAVIEDSLREVIARRQQVQKRPPVRLTTVGGQGILLGVELDQSASLLELMEAKNAPV